MYGFYLFLKRAVVTFTSYRVRFVLTAFGGLFALVQFSFIGKFLTDGNSFPAISQYGGDILAYLLIGGAFQVFVTASLGSFQSTIRAEQRMGTLEFLLLSNMSLERVLVYAGTISFLQSIVNVTILITAVTLIIGVAMNVNVLAALATIVLMILALSGIGLASAGIIIVTKVGDPINWTFSTMTTLLSGVFYPIEYLPGWLQHVSRVLPTTHALHALRLALIQDAPIGELLPAMRLLALIAVVTLPIGFFVLRWGYDKARRDGSLAHY